MKDHIKQKPSREDLIKELSMGNPYYYYSFYKKHPYPSVKPEVWGKEITKELKI
jgi:hypothetical protein